MAINSNDPRQEFTATAGQTDFTFNFKIYADTDIVAYLTPVGQVADDTADLLTLTTDYTIAIDGDNGGTLTLVSPATLDDTVVILRELDYTRTTDYQTGGDLLADTLDEDQNYQTYLTQQLKASQSRFIKAADAAAGLNLQLPAPVPLYFFQWNAAGTGIQNVNSLQADGFIWTAADMYTATELDAGQLDTRYYTETEIDDKSKLWDSQTTTHDFASDADYTLTAAQNLYGRIILTDSGVVLTTARNVITDIIEKNFIVQNDTAQTITVKTLAGTGISIPAGRLSMLYNDGTNIIDGNSTNFSSDTLFSSVVNGEGIDKAYVTIDAAGNILSSKNVASVVLDSTALTTINFTNNMPNTNFNVVAIYGGTAANVGSVAEISASRTVSSIQVTHATYTGAGYRPPLLHIRVSGGNA